MLKPNKKVFFSLCLMALASFTSFAQREGKDGELGPAIPNDPYAISYVDVFDNMHYDQEYRPQVHYTPITGQIADAIGLICYKGTYHLFHMYDEWSRSRKNNKNWGHAISPDLVHWEQQPQTLNTVLDNRPGSGSGIVDWNNTLKLQSGVEKTLAIFYTDYGRGICIAISRDAGKTWIRHKANPIIPKATADSHTRDPLVFWYQPDQSWRMILYDDKDFKFYKSETLLSWQYLSSLGGFFECPDFFQLAVDGNPANKKWVIVDGDGSYRIGDFDGTQFTSDMANTKVDFGGDLYATQSWKHSYDGGGPVVQIGMLRKDGKQAGAYAKTWSMQQCFPCELSLRTIDKKVSLCRNPINALKELRYDPQFFRNVTLSEGQNAMASVSGDVLEIVMTISPDKAKMLTWDLRGEKLQYDVKGQQLTFMGKSAPLKLVNDKLNIRMIIDRSSVEIFANDGAVSLSKLFLPAADNKSYALSSSGGSAKIETMEVYKLRPIWLAREQELGYQRKAGEAVAD